MATNVLSDFFRVSIKGDDAHQIPLLSRPPITINFSMPPQQIKVNTASRMVTIDMMEIGTIAVPRGEDVGRISWDGILPGALRSNSPFVLSDVWAEPTAIVDVLRSWHGKDYNCHLYVSHRTKPGLISYPVSVASFESNYGGGFGDIMYSIELQVRRKVIIQAYGGNPGQINTALREGRSLGRSRQRVRQRSYQTRPGDTLAMIAKRVTGNTNDWRRIWKANETIIPDPTVVTEGIVITIPDN